jgi:hypothetical protein
VSIAMSQVAAQRYEIQSKLSPHWVSQFSLPRLQFLLP